MLNKFISIYLLLFAGCDGEFCKRRMEIVPGLVWEYYSIHHSRVISDKYGIIADGHVFMTFHEYGFDVSGGDKLFYVDLTRNTICDNEEVLASLMTSSKMLTSFDASSAMGMFTKESHKDYVAEMEALKKRVEEKMRREGLRRL